MCGGGDGGDGGAGQREAERQARIRNISSQISALFDDPRRKDLYAEQKAAVYDLNKRDLDKQLAAAQRENTYALARNGLLSSGQDIASTKLVDDTGNEGLIKTQALAEQAAADMRTADEKSRSQLLGQAQSDADASATINAANAQLSANANNASAQRGAAQLGSLFDNLAAAYQWNKQKEGTQAGTNAANQWAQNPNNSNVRSRFQGTVTG